MELHEYRDPSNLSGVLREWELLLNNPAWVSLVKALQDQADSMQNEVMFGEIHGPETLYMMERMKGRIEGRISITATALAMYESVKQDLETARATQGENDVAEE